jgi:GrpB-like predicted nucleotidyltransferase (UPF0157 family)
MVVVEQLTFLLFLKMADEQAKAPYLSEAPRRDAAATLAYFLRADLSARPKARSCPRTPKGKCAVWHSQEITDYLAAALEQFATIAEDLKAGPPGRG